MGGKLLNGRRVNREEFFKLEEEVVTYLKSNLLSQDIRKLHHLSDKESFGDLDLIVSNTLTESCMKLLSSSETSYKKNGDVLSFLWNGLQVDLIFVSPELLEYSVKYFSHGDKSNLLGKLIKYNFGLTFSSKGVYKKFNFDDGVYVYKQYLDENLDYDSTVFKLLGLAPKESYTEEELFEWVYSSSLFKTTIYHLPMLTSEQRVRDKDRPFYQRWLEFLESKPLKEGYDNRVFTVEYLNHIYPKYESYTSFHLNEYEIKKQEKKAFNGTQVSELTNLVGKALGDFIKWLKEYNSSSVIEDHQKSFEEWSKTIKVSYDEYNKHSNPT